MKDKSDFLNPLIWTVLVGLAVNHTWKAIQKTEVSKWGIQIYIHIIGHTIACRYLTAIYLIINDEMLWKG